MLGFRAPLGAFIAAWGGIAMITSAPFDNWWHAAYGLDVKIVSPPHTLLILGIRAVSVGVLFLILAAMNRAMGDDSSSGEQTYKTLQRLFLYVGGLIVSGQMFFLIEYTWDVQLHSAIAYVAMGDRAAAGLRDAFPGVPLQVGGNHHRRRVHDLCDRRDSHPSALSRAAEAWPRLQPRHPPGPCQISHPDLRSRARPRSSLAKNARMETLEGRARLRAFSSSLS